ncbi:MAG: tetratricopeptide repeat protein [Cyclobacteriaceae bacterium]|nr:tetratricopeptide repeat protein [Cyclobacteriaceae bacterium]
MLVLLAQLLVCRALPGQTSINYDRHPSREIYEAAFNAMQEKKFDLASISFTQAISGLDSTKEIDYNMLWQALAFRGVCKRELNDLWGALADFDRAILFYPEVIQTHVRRAYVLIELGELEKAKTECLWILSKDQTSSYAASAHDQLGMIYFQRGDLKKSISEFSKALKISPRATTTLAKRAQAFSRMGAQWEAVEDYSRIIKITPQYAVAYRDRALEKVKLAQKSNSKKIMLSACKDLDQAMRFGDTHAAEYREQYCEN